MKVWVEFGFEAAHRPDGAAPHGHSFRCRVWVRGPLMPDGMVLDLDALRAVVEPVRARLDHADLNQVDGLPNPTIENVARWIWSRLAADLPKLDRVEVQDTPTSGCVLTARRGNS